MTSIFRPLAAAFALSLAALSLAACTTPSDTTGTKTISAQGWGYFQEYLRTIGPSNPGAFAMSEDGNYSFYYYCEAVRCMPGGTYRRGAVERCEAMAKQDCYTFASGRDILVSYKVRE